MRSIYIALLSLCACSYSDRFTYEAVLDNDSGTDVVSAPDVVFNDSSNVGDHGSNDGGVCASRHLVLPGAPGAAVYFAGPDNPGSGVEVIVRLKSNELANVVRRGPENPCGWQVSVNGAQIHAAVTASFDHFAVVPIENTGWRRVRWTIEAGKSVITVDGAEISRQDVVGPPMGACSGKTTLGAVSNASGVPYGWDTGQVAELAVGSSRWTFDEPDGPARDKAGTFDGVVNPGVVRECD